MLSNIRRPCDLPPQGAENIGGVRVGALRGHFGSTLVKRHNIIVGRQSCKAAPFRSSYFRLLQQSTPCSARCRSAKIGKDSGIDDQLFEVGFASQYSALSGSTRRTRTPGSTWDNVQGDLRHARQLREQASETLKHRTALGAARVWPRAIKPQHRRRRQRHAGPIRRRMPSSNRVRLRLEDRKRSSSNRIIILRYYRGRCGRAPV
jgi:hypothetical protein